MTNFEKWLKNNGLDRFYAFANLYNSFAPLAESDEFFVRYKTIKAIQKEIYRGYQNERRELGYLKNVRRL